MVEEVSGFCAELELQILQMLKFLKTETLTLLYPGPWMEFLLEFHRCREPGLKRRHIEHDDPPLL